MSNDLVKKDGDFSISELFKPSNLLKPEDAEFLKKHADKFEQRFATRSLFRSRFEMESSVLNDDVHKICWVETSCPCGRGNWLNFLLTLNLNKLIKI